MVMVQTAARKLLAEFVDSNPDRVLTSEQVTLLAEMTANNDMTVPADAIEQLSMTVKEGGAPSISELALLLTQRLAAEETAVKLKALRLIMNMGAKCGPPLTDGIERDTVRLLELTINHEAPPDPQVRRGPCANLP
jgi:hypothetical protein